MQEDPSRSRVPLAYYCQCHGVIRVPRRFLLHWPLAFVASVPDVLHSSVLFAGSLPPLLLLLQLPVAPWPRSWLLPIVFSPAL